MQLTLITLLSDKQLRIHFSKNVLEYRNVSKPYQAVYSIFSFISFDMRIHIWLVSKLFADIIRNLNFSNHHENFRNFSRKFIITIFFKIVFGF